MKEPWVNAGELSAGGDCFFHKTNTLKIMKHFLLMITLATVLPLAAAETEHPDALTLGDTVSVPDTHLLLTVVEDSTGTVGASISISEQVKQKYLTSLTDITIPETIEIPRQGWTQTFKVISLEANALSNLTYLKTLTIPSTVTNIHQNACSNNPNLTAVKISGGEPQIGQIGNSAFEGCTSLAEFPADQNLSSIGEKAFSGCSSLKTINAGSRLTWIGSNAFENSGLTTFDLTGATHIYLAPYAFANATNLESITFHENLTALQSNTFQNCTSLKNVDLSQTNIGYVGSSAFDGCSAVETVSLPASVGHIDSKAFGGCEKISTINIAATQAPSLAADAFPESVFSNPNLVINYPEGSEASYTNPYGSWSKFKVLSDETVGISQISAEAASAPVEYFTTTGQRVAEPVPGMLLIRRQGPSAVKVIYNSSK